MIGFTIGIFLMCFGISYIFMGGESDRLIISTFLTSSGFFVILITLSQLVGFINQFIGWIEIWI